MKIFGSRRGFCWHELTIHRDRKFKRSESVQTDNMLSPRKSAQHDYNIKCSWALILRMITENGIQMPRDVYLSFIDY